MRPARTARVITQSPRSAAIAVAASRGGGGVGAGEDQAGRVSAAPPSGAATATAPAASGRRRPRVVQPAGRQEVRRHADPRARRGAQRGHRLGRRAGPPPRRTPTGRARRAGAERVARPASTVARAAASRVPAAASTTRVERPVQLGQPPAQRRPSSAVGTTPSTGPSTSVDGHRQRAGRRPGRRPAPPGCRPGRGTPRSAAAAPRPPRAWPAGGQRRRSTCTGPRPGVVEVRGAHVEPGPRPPRRARASARVAGAAPRVAAAVRDAERPVPSARAGRTRSCRTSPSGRRAGPRRPGVRRVHGQQPIERVPLLEQRVDRHVVAGDVRVHVGLGPRGERGDLDLAAARRRTPTTGVLARVGDSSRRSPAAQAS